MEITGYHMSGNTLANSNGEMVIEDHLTWLAEQLQDTLKIFYNLNYAVAQLAKAVKMTEKEGRKLLSKGQLYFPPHQIGHIPNKYLSVKHGFYKNAPFSNYADASQYDKGVEISNDDRREYCIARAVDAAEIGEKVYNALRKIGLHPTTLTSPISAYYKEVMSKMNLPTVDDTPPEAAEMAYECCCGNWVECFVRGHWGEDKPVYDYDLSSAYPSQVAKLLDTRYGTWKHVPIYMPEAVYGYCKGIVDIKKPFSPIIFSAKDNHNYTPIGRWECCITKGEWDFINKHNLGSFECRDAWWWIPTKYVRPLEVPVAYLFKIKEQTVGLEREVVKRVCNGLYGKFLELKQGEMGDNFNSVWGAEIEVPVRLKVAEFCIQAIKSGLDTISVAVDGAIVSGEMPSNILKELDNQYGA